MIFDVGGIYAHIHLCDDPGAPAIALVLMVISHHAQRHIVLCDDGKIMEWTLLSTTRKQLA